MLIVYNIVKSKEPYKPTCNIVKGLAADYLDFMEFWHLLNSCTSSMSLYMLTITLIFKF